MTTHLASLKNRPVLRDFHHMDGGSRRANTIAPPNVAGRNLMSPRDYLLAYKKDKRPPSTILRMQ